MITENIADKTVNKLVVISENSLVKDFPKYPNIAPAKGKNITAYSI